MRWRGIVDIWLSHPPFVGSLSAKQARDFDQRREGWTARFRGFWLKLPHFDPAPSPWGGEGRNGQIESSFVGGVKGLGYGSARHLASS